MSKRRSKKDNGKKISIFNLANALSASRIFFIPFLFILIFLELKWFFFVFYILVAATDLFDGMAARKLNQKTEFGKHLDSIADLVFILATAIFIYIMFPDYILRNEYIVAVASGFVGGAFFLSMWKFHRPVFMHTILLKIGAFAVLGVLICSFFFDTTYIITATLTLYIAAFLEQMAIHIWIGDVDLDTKSILVFLKKRKKTNNK